MQSNLDGQSILVTGASGGIGTAIVKQLAREGATPILHTHTNRSRAEALAEELAPITRTPLPIVTADLSSAAAVEHMWEEILQKTPKVDGVIANAGVWTATPRPLEQLSPDQWRHTLSVNLDGVFYVARGFFNHLMAQPREEASLIFISSTAALFGEAGHADYAASKAALTYGLTPTLKNEIVRLAPRGRVNCICPGWTHTPMATQALSNPEFVRRSLATIALQKLATPEDIAQAAVFLSSSTLAGHVTGLVMPIHGGMEGRVLHHR